MNRSIALAIGMLSLAAGAGMAAQQRQDDRALLEVLASGPTRETLPADISFLDEDGALVAGVRCATRRPSDLESELVDRIAVSTRLRGGEAGEPITIDVVFHVVQTAEGRFGVPARRLRRQIDLLNEAFRDSGFSFRTARVRRYRDTRFARHCDDGGVERAFKEAHAVDPDTTLNVYTCRPRDQALGWATFPWSNSGAMQGVVALYSSLPGGGAAPYDEGDTVVHEVGHWLGLYHTFQGGCSRRGDSVADTPSQATPTYGCPDFRDSCAKPGLDPIHNFMDYSDDRCMNNFTPLQQERMRDIVDTYRSGLAG